MDNENARNPEELTSLEETQSGTEMIDASNDLPEQVEPAAEPLEPARFVAKTTLNAAIQLEASKQLAPKFGMVTSVLGIGLMVVLLGITLWQYFTTWANDRLLMAGVLVLVIAFLIYSRLSAPKKALKNWETKLRRTYGTDALHLTTEFFEHSLAQSVDEIDDLIVEGYSKLSELRETEHLLLLRCSAKQWFFVEKAGFTTGTADEFREFIRSRMGR